jgi:threonine/homoserine/homoserine lactone efflux protein
MWRAPVAAADTAEPELADIGPRPSRVFAHAWLVTALNPKSIVFFVAFLPLFLDPARRLLPQLAVMEATFLVLAVANAAAYAWLAGLARGKVRQPSVRRAVNRIGGSLMVGAALLALALRRGPA